MLFWQQQRTSIISVCSNEQFNPTTTDIIRKRTHSDYNGSSTNISLRDFLDRRLFIGILKNGKLKRIKWSHLMCRGSSRPMC
ncbi:hypothetical protein DPMN_073036 [Dreissena polymorpha]|uniref:Uncharacterized protein n=1 Tax=Dreissena polymorpha TaxID=45954 RepID=A0A9D4HAB9_DREPO|nr:hypothetical protein DPMN_073036 [Dreissena polymorpha]